MSRSNRSVDRAKELAVALVGGTLIACACGCAVAKIPAGVVDLTLGTNLSGVNTPPSTTWKANPKSSTSRFPKVAVYVENLSNDERSKAGANLERAVEDEFIGSLLQKGYKVASRSDVEKLMQEIAFQESGKTKQAGLPDNKVAQIGKMLNVPAVVIASIQEASTRNLNDGSNAYFAATGTVSARLISVEEGEQIGLSSYSSHMTVNDRNHVFPVVMAAAKVVAASIPEFK